MVRLVDWREQEATNQTIFREMNEWTLEMSEWTMEARDGDDVDSRIDTYLCACSDSLCTAPIELTRSEYELVRAVPINFAIAINHENPELDHVLAEYERFALVEKLGVSPTRIARDTDPRR